MTRDDIIRMAEECGIPEFENNESQADCILNFAALVAAAEREQCFTIAKDWDKDHPNTNYGGCIAAAIRARGQE